MIDYFIANLSIIHIVAKSFPFPNPLLGGWFVSRRLLLSQLHFYFVAPKSRSSFVANIRYIVYDCSSSIGQSCAGSIFAIRTRSSLCNSATSRSISSLILPLDFVVVFYCSTMISSPQSCWHTLLCYGWIYLWWLASLSWGTYRTTLLICPPPIVGSILLRS